MHIKNLSITNFKALKHLEIHDAPNVIVLAGPNGCGKTCVLDAIRLLKSAYGGYIPNESQSWFNEFNIAFKNGRIEGASLFQDPTINALISADFFLSESERSYLAGDISELVRDLALNEIADAPFQPQRNLPSLAVQARQGEPAIAAATLQIRTAIEQELSLPLLSARLTLYPDGTYTTSVSRLLELLFSTFKPDRIGVLDFQSAARHYQREPSAAINITIDQTPDLSKTARTHALYNSSQRYSNLKQQLSTAYVKALIAAKAGEGDEAAVADAVSTVELSETLKELFTTFIPGKTFSGPVPSLNGSLQYVVSTAAGAKHDINDLSSGEKEVLYGYLLLRNRTPRNSILMIDEPELHLNPRLLLDLPKFYSKHLASSLGNQLWLVTHSDAIVRGAIATAGAKVLHVQPAERLNSANQLTPVLGDTDMQALVLDLVGDLASYRPNAPIVIFEGGGEDAAASEFDVHMVARLFPEFSKQVNSVSGHDKKRVKNLHAALDDARKNGLISQSVFAIVDLDDDGDGASAFPSGTFCWDRYHIENYLLEPKFIVEAVKELCAEQALGLSEAQVDTMLRECAKKSRDELLSHRTINIVQSKIRSSINIGFGANQTDVRKSIEPSIRATQARLELIWRDSLAPERLDLLIERTAAELDAALGTDGWRTKLPGRRILKTFAAQCLSTRNGGIGYFPLRNSILGRMENAGFKPSGMLATLNKVGLPFAI